ncbi:YjcZ family sporulation protein [Sporosarcina sp. PTS2304]|uniref:YjcZ family sporulation protein n=1 Tax=Sporosarcina sp. PTS2304 TaxID=2283194 RepID=UPI000E0DD013|nr:YjcZ family sporulation protein [Sporosarcina sp. PTS2304]AXH98472.1 YjcZ family sporulation protein [Sporosarcina sp. PTS2304]
MFGFGGYGGGYSPAGCGNYGGSRPGSTANCGTGSAFALIVVLFILLIIVGAACL